MGKPIDVNGINKGLFIQAGIDPKTGLPFKLTDGNNSCKLKVDVKKCLRIRDEQDAVNRYTWYNLPNITSTELERLIYYKGQICMFPMETEGGIRFYYMPYALDGTIDFYGRFNQIHPVPFASGTDDEKTDRYKAQLQVLSMLKLKPIYEIPTKPMSYDELMHCAVILRDYTPQLGQTIIPRVELQDSIIDYMSEILPMSRTALRNATGVQGMRVPDEDSSANVMFANRAIDNAVLSGQRLVPVVGAIEFQDLAGGEVAKAEEFQLSMQTIDNFRRSMYGLNQGGLFEKKAHMLQAEITMNSSIAEMPLVDGLTLRQTACDIANVLWGYGISCEISEAASEADKDGDGMADNSEQQAQGAATNIMTEDNNNNDEV